MDTVTGVELFEVCSSIIARPMSTRVGGATSEARLWTGCVIGILKVESLAHRVVGGSGRDSDLREMPGDEFEAHF
jgi:hypothetical protein